MFGKLCAKELGFGRARRERGRCHSPPQPPTMLLDSMPPFGHPSATPHLPPPPAPVHQLAFTPQRAVRPAYGGSGRTIKVKANW